MAKTSSQRIIGRLNAWARLAGKNGVQESSLTARMTSTAQGLRLDLERKFSFPNSNAATAFLAAFDEARKGVKFKPGVVVEGKIVRLTHPVVGDMNIITNLLGRPVVDLLLKSGNPLELKVTGSVLSHKSITVTERDRIHVRFPRLAKEQRAA